MVVHLVGSVTDGGGETGLVTTVLCAGQSEMKKTLLRVKRSMVGECKLEAFLIS